LTSIANTIILRYERNGEKFELLVDPKLSYEFKIGQKKDLNNVIMSEEIYKDVNKGERQTSANIKKAFGTEDVTTIALIMFKDGDLQLTTDQKRKLTEEKRIKIISLINRICVDPKTKAPHPMPRIESAMEQARVHIDPFKTPEEQAEKIIEELREIIPISTQQAKIKVTIPVMHVSRAYPYLKQFSYSQEEWTSNGDLNCVVEMPAGMIVEFYDRLNRLTAGQAITKGE